MPGKGGRPSAEALRAAGRACHGLNTKGAPCGAPAVHGFAHCPWHLTDIDKHNRETLGEQLLTWSQLAIDTLVDTMRNARRPEDRVAAAKAILARTAPLAGPNQLNIFVGQGDDGRSSEADIIRARLADIRGQIDARPSVQGSDSQPFAHLAADDIVDAEIIPEPEPVAPQDISDPEPFVTPPEPIVTPPDADDVTVLVPRAYGVPRVTSRPADLDQLAYRRSFRGA